MRFFSNIIFINILLLLAFSTASGQGQEGKLGNPDSFHRSFIAPLSYSELFETNSYYPVNQKKIQPFNFLKDYRVEIYDVLKWYVNNDVGAYIITYNKPVMYYHLVNEDYIIVKKRKK